VPPYDVPAYCPYGIGQGYCGSPTTGENASTDCDPFRDMVCPCATGDDDSVSCPDDSPNYGDVMVTSYQRFEFARFPDPTDAAKPKHMCGDERAVHGHSAWLRHVYHLLLFPHAAQTQRFVRRLPGATRAKRPLLRGRRSWRWPDGRDLGRA